MWKLEGFGQLKAPRWCDLMLLLEIDFRLPNEQTSIKPAANRSWRQLYASMFFKNATVCTQVKSPTQLSNSEGTADGGLAFWAVNTSYYFAAAIRSNGYFSIKSVH